jgi:hypothetical protein
MKDMTGKIWTYTIISEVAFYAFLYYVQMLLGVGGNLWVSSIILWILLNLSIVLCPVINPAIMKK